jgi:hypothetical protein
LTKYLKEISLKEEKFILVVLKDSVHGHLALMFLACDEAELHVRKQVAEQST